MPAVVCNGCDSDVAHSGSQVKRFFGSVVVYIVFVGGCVCGSVILIFLLAVRIFYSSFRVARVVVGTCDRALVPIVYFIARFILFVTGFA